MLYDTARGVLNKLSTNLTDPQGTNANTVTAFNTDGFSLGTDTSTGRINQTGDTYASWTFRKQPKFFDVVTYTGNGASNRQITHNLGSVPGCIIIKCTSTTSDWPVYHRSLADTEIILLNSTAAKQTDDLFGNVDPTSAYFVVNGTDTKINASGATYVAYLFAHNAGGFGTSGADNVISCGSCTGGGGTIVNLGYEPQWLLIKRTNSAQNWFLMDNMRGLDSNQGDMALSPNLSNAEPTAASNFNITSTGFVNAGLGTTSDTYIYIAIRRGPMKTPTTGTEVFGISARSGTGANATVTGGSLPDDLAIIKNRASAQLPLWVPRLTGTGYLNSSATSAEVAAGTTILQANPWDVMNGVKVGTTSAITNASGNTFVNYLFTRAPGFFDVVCYTGNGSTNRQVNHNLGVKPELVIYKPRNDTSNWVVFTNYDYEMYLNMTTALQGPGYEGNHGDPTSTYLVAQGGSNTNSYTFVTYLFATVAGVSKVGSYTGTGATQTINAGLASGARFVMIKRTDSTGNWFVWDTARGMVAGTDPRLALNLTDAESNANWVYTASTGFQIVTTDASVNASGGTYIYLAIA